MLTVGASGWADARARASIPRALPFSALGFLLLTDQLLPPLPLYLDAATSMTLGATVAAGVNVFVWLLNGLLSRRGLRGHLRDFDISTPLIVLSVTCAVLLHAVVADRIQSIDLAKCVASLVPLIFLLAGGMVLGELFSRARDSTVERVLTLSLWVLCGVMLLQAIGAQPRQSAFPKSIFPFTETSHFALAFFPILLYRCVRARGLRQLAWLAAVFAIALWMESLSLLVGAVLATIACRRALLLTLSALAVAAVGMPFELAYFTSRLDFSGAVMNLSNLVYIQGWQLVGESLERSSNWGIGFQQLGHRDTDAAAADLIRQVTNGVDANLTDGSFVFSKLASEFGVIGIILSVAYLIGAARCMSSLRRRTAGSLTTFARCVVVAYFVDMFVRGTGYFTQSTLLFITAVAILMKPSRSGGEEGSPHVSQPGI